MGNSWFCCLCKTKKLLPKKPINWSQVNYDNTSIKQYNFTHGKVVKVYDGDTFWIALVEDNKVVRYNCRLYGVDTPEIRGGTEETKKKGQEAKQYVTRAILNKIVSVEVLNGKKINNKVIKEKYGRLLVKVWYDDHIDLAKDLLDKGLAKEYYGGTK